MCDDAKESLSVNKHSLAVSDNKRFYFKAEQLILEALEGRRPKLGDTHPHTQESLKNLIDVYEARGKPEEAEKWRAKLRQKTGTEE
jgi:hypothetical protein